MYYMQRALRVGLFLLMAATIALPASAADIVAFDASASGLTWRPLVSFEHGMLTVSTPDGLVFSETFKGGSGISFNPTGQPNYQPPDGTYLWQVTLGKPSAVNAKLRAAAGANRAGDGDPDVEAAHRAASARATLIQSGAFQILNGAIVPSNLVEPGAKSAGAGSGSMTTDAFRQANWIYDDPAVRQVDQVIPDDLIVQGSACVGLDCVNNENFGFDTIRLKENNTRIHFDDTSTQAGFPANDWRLIANDSASGGSSKFSIEDSTGAKTPFTITAGASTNSIFVDSTGRVGFRTSTPVLDLHINTGNTPAVRLEQNNSAGFTAQTWDIGANEANFFVRDVTGGSKLSFRVRPGAPTSSIDIAADGDVGMGTASPTINGGGLEISRTGQAAVRISNTAASGKKVELGVDTTGGFIQTLTTGATFRIFTDNAAGPRVNVDSAGNVTLSALTNCGTGIKTDGAGLLSCITSTRETKNVDGDLLPHVALANVMALRPQIGSYKESPDVPEHWLIAEEAAAVDPALVGLANGKPYVVKTQNVVADLIAVVQLQQRRIEEQQRFIQEQQRRLEALEQASPRKN
ncbi:MAG TPA: hypothetical protein VK548_25095 [Candidatus Acidoferrum sp.]|nr:hypothetical protein [Candidatus Acidoferrum sp.]